MAPRELFHKAKGVNWCAALGLLASLAWSSACTDASAVPASARSNAGSDASNVASASKTSAVKTLPPAGYAWVIFEADTVVAEVAATPDERAQGLMYRDEIPDGTGMLFVFQDSQPRSFWMANTYIPLDIAYMNPSYRIVDIIAMEPLVTDSYPSDAPAMFALEVRQNWFAEQGITVGSQASIVFGIQGG